MDAISFANNSQYCWMFKNAASFSTLCCMFLEVVAEGLKPVKLLACKQTQQFPKVLGVVGQQCCVGFHGASIGKTITLRVHHAFVHFFAVTARSTTT